MILTQKATVETPLNSHSALLGTLCDALRPSLDAVRVAAELLERQTLPAEAAVCVRTLLENGERLKRAVAQAEDLARSEEPLFEREPVSVQALLDELQASWAETGRPVLTALDGPRELLLWADPNRLRQLLEGLVRHACDQRGRRGAVEVTLSVKADAGYARLVCHVCYAEDRASEPHSPAGALNLAFCRELARAMGGGLEVSGGVLVFEIELPEATAASTVSEPAPEAETPGLHVLIVDDNATNRLVAEAFCDMFGCTSDTAADGVDALEVMARRAFDVVLMDIRMPRMDGLEATAAIRALPGPERDTPVIALTANADPEDVRRYLAAGMRAVVEKPIKADRLAEVLTSVIEQSGARAAA